VVTGPKGCKIPSKTFSLTNIMTTEATDCKITWENAANCPAQDCGTGGKIAASGIVKVTYIAEPPLLACGKMTSLTVKRDGALACTGLTNIASPSLYYIKESLDKTSCEVATNPVRGV